MVDIETNPLYYAAVGGILLGISTSLNYVLRGNITGMSGLIYDVAFFNISQFPNKLIILAGMIIASGIFFDIFGYGTYHHFTPFGPQENISEFTSFIGFAISGLLTGFGTKLSNGCTSGHGLCGLPRLSIRSFVAVGIFLTSGISISTLRYYVTLGPLSQKFNPSIDYAHVISANLCIILGIFCLPVGFLIEKLYNKPDQDSKTIIKDNLISLAVGLIFGTGLVVAGMARRRNILFFLAMGVDWNPSLLFVLGCGVIFNLIVFNYMIRIRKIPIFSGQLFNPSNSTIDWRLVLGALCFGLGWGIGGICPGPALVLLPVFQVQIHVIWLGCLVFGMFLASKLAYQEEKKVSLETPEAQSPTKSKPENPMFGTEVIENSGAINLDESTSKIELNEVQNKKLEFQEDKLSKIGQQRLKGSSTQSRNPDPIN